MLFDVFVRDTFSLLNAGPWSSRDKVVVVAVEAKLWDGAGQTVIESETTRTEGVSASPLDVE